MPARRVIAAIRRYVPPWASRMRSANTQPLQSEEQRYRNEAQAKLLERALITSRKRS